MQPTGAASYLNVAANLGIVALPIGLLMIAGELDISIGAMIPAGAMTVAIVSGHYGAPIIVGMGAALALGVIIGLINGFLTVRTAVPSLIVTLGTLFAVQGLVLGLSVLLTGTTSVALTAPGWTKAIFGSFIGNAFQVIILWWLLLTAVYIFIIHFSRYGNWIFAMGGDRESARNVGIPTNKLTIILFRRVVHQRRFRRHVSDHPLQLRAGLGRHVLHLQLDRLGRGGRRVADGRLRIGHRHLLRHAHVRHRQPGHLLHAVRCQLGEPDHRRPAPAGRVDEQHVPQDGAHLQPEEGEIVMSTPIIELRNVNKSFGPIDVLHDISLKVSAGEVLCLLGDNGAGKSTLIKTLSGVHQPTSGQVLMDGKEVSFSNPREAQEMGIATVHQFGGTFPLMSVGRCFFIGNEPTKSWGPFKIYDRAKANAIAVKSVQDFGITRIDDGDRLVGGMSGGERQSLAIARAVYFGARVLILDEPTAALGVKQASHVLRIVLEAKKRGLAVIFITHQVMHAMTVGDHFAVLIRGALAANFMKGEKSREENHGSHGWGRSPRAVISAYGQRSKPTWKTHEGHPPPSRSECAILTRSRNRRLGFRAGVPRSRRPSMVAAQRFTL